MNKKIKAWAIINKKGKLDNSMQRGYWIFKTKKKTERFCLLEEGQKVVKIEISYDI